jgi:hypothetical protein
VSTHCPTVDRGLAKAARAKIASCWHGGKWSAHLASSNCAGRPVVGFQLAHHPLRKSSGNLPHILSR